MKKAFVVFCLMVLAHPSIAAEYIVRRGETLTMVAKRTGYTVDELSKMNRISQDRPIKVGQVLLYINDQDIADARRWCEKRLAELISTAMDDSREALVDLERKHFCYAGNCPSGLTTSDLFDYVKWWREEIAQ